LFPGKTKRNTERKTCESLVAMESVSCSSSCAAPPSPPYSSSELVLRGPGSARHAAASSSGQVVLPVPVPGAPAVPSSGTGQPPPRAILIGQSQNK